MSNNVSSTAPTLRQTITPTCCETVTHCQPRKSPTTSLNPTITPPTLTPTTPKELRPLTTSPETTKIKLDPTTPTTEQEPQTSERCPSPLPSPHLQQSLGHSGTQIKSGLNPAATPGESHSSASPQPTSPPPPNNREQPSSPIQAQLQEPLPLLRDNSAAPQKPHSGAPPPIHNTTPLAS
ncbi:hypothetical protein E4T56_gene8065 [Termitomyces sp. T112]|nr:hypothetical protein E4T56_gene8065 [Termitomyces sp. T112]